MSPEMSSKVETMASRLKDRRTPSHVWMVEIYPGLCARSIMYIYILWVIKGGGEGNRDEELDSCMARG